jgi:K+-sensing histidine kinase KdpD
VRYPQIEARVLLSPDTSSTRVLGSGQLLSRALRNALENAFSFATSKVIIEIRHERSFIIIDILDDGPGLSEEQLNQFGKKRISRSIQRQQKQNRISVGLGSVIMAQVSTIHGGTVEIVNLKVQDQVIGAQLTFTLPRFIYS